MILITHIFQKEMKGFDSGILPEIVKLVGKHTRGLEKNIFTLQEYGDYIILKGYLQGKSVRIIIAKYKESVYIPLVLLRKESRSGWNITSDYDISIPLLKAQKCIQNDEYKIVQIS